jgi:eukaryotic-like serine/threonine-protein kinase
MTPERWQQIRDVLERALELAAGERSTYLNQACASDPSLRQEVETLLASSPDVRSSFLESSALRVTLTSGTKLGEYEVKSLLGSGGMGEVYRARDSRLGRDVAIKVLPSFLSADSGRLRRFEQEARAAAALNHPNILAVFQMGAYEGAPYMVSELLEGETLREQIKRGRLAVRKAIDYGVQIARGLAAAHEKGIVHRDLKPENLFVTKDGRVKILDFGLAKLTQPQSSSEHSAPTFTEGTEAGAVMGTVGYMAPEQVRGQTADHRADIFAFGAILYEMLAGKRAFQKPTSPETMTAILNEDPPGISQVTPNLPPALQRVVHRCLEKNPEQRFQSASDLAFALDALSESGGSGYSATAAKAATGAGKRWKQIVPAALAVLLSVGGYFYSHRRPKLTDKDTIVLADFVNHTGDPVFDDALKQALSVQLEQSPFLNIVSDRKVSETLKLMGRSPSDHVTPEVAKEICVRTGGRAVLTGLISSLGSEYLVGLEAVACNTGDVLAKEQAEATSKEGTPKVLGQLTDRLRVKLGESLASVEKFEAPLEATTSSLEALKAHSMAHAIFNTKGAAEAIPFDKHAIELDPDFASAYVGLGIDYDNLGQYALATDNFKKAYALRDRASEREKYRITELYQSQVTGDLQKETEALELWKQIYPTDSVAHNDLAVVYTTLGQFEKALAEYQESLRLGPDYVNTYANLAFTYILLNRLDDAKKVVEQAQARKLDREWLHEQSYNLAFMHRDQDEMNRQVAWAAGRPGDEDKLLAMQRDTEAYYGRVRRAREFSRRAVDSANRADLKEAAALHVVGSALIEANLGNAEAAKHDAISALELDSGRRVKIDAAFALAQVGDTERAKKLVAELEKNYPSHARLKMVFLPLVRAAIYVNSGDAAHALSTLEVTLPYELGSGLYPAYLRGQIQLSAHNGTAAVTEFQKLRDHPGVVLNDPIGALAHLQLGRAYAMAGDARKAKAAYQDFLTLWKDADPDIPILKEAKAEYAKLQ